jgi:hypothetical protein
MIKRFVNFYQRQDGVVFWATCAAILAALLIMAFWAVNFPFLPTKLPLFYSLPWGERQLVSTTQFLILPGVIFLVIFINIIISWHLHKSQLLLKRMLALNSLVISILLLLTALRVIYTFI